MELSDLFDLMPDAPFVPKKRVTAHGMSSNDADQPLPTPPTLLARIKTFIWGFSIGETSSSVAPPNAFLSLKTGRRNVVIAAVDRGSVSFVRYESSRSRNAMLKDFVRFNQGCFEDWPMYPSRNPQPPKKGRT
jgi:hypothetical protein